MNLLWPGELIVVITAMNNDLIMARRRAIELIMAIAAMSNICLPIAESLFKVIL